MSRRREGKRTRRRSTVRPRTQMQPGPLPPWLARKVAGRPELGTCFVCRSPDVDGIGIFEPREPWRYCPDAPTAGKKRVLIYSLCAACTPRSEAEHLRVADVVESELLRRMAEARP